MIRATRGLVLLILVGILVLTAGCSLFQNRPPTAAFVVAYGVTEDPLVVDLDATSSSDPDGDAISTYWWTFGEVGVDIITPLVDYSKTVHVSVLRVRFAEEGTHRVRLLVADERGGISEEPFEADVTVPNVPVSPTL